ncbi:probable serine/threonine-protein kinase DDB_G0271682 isoform X2 [Drosophila obscura]|uniref:probable serine/threonine-protein kinase DDB_G0271682 isoform X2 n=1 Tax=Drosophila obscura TaxID=7282 RepID=UPI001BB26212|nr:probable serine/threonine-protein kinase DDB_G0271682 isoform X2 [Drosophila obscura]
MVLTNFECWAHADSAGPNSNFETGQMRQTLDPFNPRAVSYTVAPPVVATGGVHYAFMNDPNNNEQPMDAAAASAARCKKRCNGNEPSEDGDNPMYTKRCRFDDVDLAAQYCNDFFSLPATQIIGTQACLMDYEMQASGGGAGDMMEAAPQQHQHQEQQQQQQQQQQRLQQHFQGHLHRANRDTQTPKRNSSCCTDNSSSIYPEK